MHQTLYIVTKFDQKRVFQQPVRVSALLKEWQTNVEQLTLKTVWESACDYLIQLLTRFNWLVSGLPPRENPAAAPTN